MVELSSGSSESPLFPISLKYETDGSVKVILGCGATKVFSAAEWEVNFEYEGSHGWTHEALLDILVDETIDDLCITCGKWMYCHFGQPDDVGSHGRIFPSGGKS